MDITRGQFEDTDCNALQLGFFRIFAHSGGTQRSTADLGFGSAALRQFEHIDLTQAIAQVLDNPRDPDLIEHSFLEMVPMRIFSILAGYEEQNNHNTLRTDPVFKLVNESGLGSGRVIVVVAQHGK